MGDVTTIIYRGRELQVMFGDARWKVVIVDLRNGRTRETALHAEAAAAVAEAKAMVDASTR